MIQGNELPCRIFITAAALGGSLQLAKPILNSEQLGQLKSPPTREPFDGEASRFRLGVEAVRLGLAYE